MPRWRSNAFKTCGTNDSPGEIGFTSIGPYVREAMAQPCTVSIGSPAAANPAESSSFHLRWMLDRDSCENTNEVVFFRECHEPTS
jgi:hypothetical protein